MAYVIKMVRGDTGCWDTLALHGGEMIAYRVLRIDA